MLTCPAERCAEPERSIAMNTRTGFHGEIVRSSMIAASLGARVNPKTFPFHEHQNGLP